MALEPKAQELLEKLRSLTRQMEPELKASFDYWQKSAAQVSASALASDRLSKEDFAIRINTPDETFSE